MHMETRRRRKSTSGGTRMGMANMPLSVPSIDPKRRLPTNTSTSPSLRRNIPLLPRVSPSFSALPTPAPSPAPSPSPSPPLALSFIPTLPIPTINLDLPTPTSETDESPNATMFNSPHFHPISPSPSPSPTRLTHRALSPVLDPLWNRLHRAGVSPVPSPAPENTSESEQLLAFVQTRNRILRACAASTLTKQLENGRLSPFAQHQKLLEDGPMDIGVHGHGASYPQAYPCESPVSSIGDHELEDFGMDLKLVPAGTLPPTPPPENNCNNNDNNASVRVAAGRPAPKTGPLYNFSALLTARENGQGHDGSSPYTISPNPPNPRMAVRQGDWWCSVPTCGTHNFGRNINCIQCSAPSPRTTVFSNAHNGPTNIAAMNTSSPRFAGLNLANAAVPAQMSIVEQQRLAVLLATSQTHTQAAALTAAGSIMPTQTRQLTPSGRAFAIGGRMQNISYDPTAPCVMFWPDNESLPEPGQIRPAQLANVQQPPIMNTGNKGPIEQQPGDWTCQKCDYLNWRRRKVCQTCFPYADGNGDSVSASMHAERLALLEATLIQNATLQLQQQQQQQQQRQQQQRQQVQVQPHRFAQPAKLLPPPTPAPTQSFAPNCNTVATNRAPYFPRRVGSTPEPSSTGNIVYQTPPSPTNTRQQFPSLSNLANALPTKAQRHVPAAARTRFTSFPPSAVARPQPNTHSGALLPSFLAHEVIPPAHPTSAVSAGTRTPASLSPASSTSIDLSNDEHDLELYGNDLSKGITFPTSRRAPGPIARPAFYAQARRTGSASGSSSATGSTSSLALGGSIWSLDQDEGKAWPGAGAFGAPGDRHIGLSRPGSFEKLRPGF